MDNSSELTSIHPAPKECMYCDHADPNCGFCEMGKPLDTQEDWDASWGHTFDLVNELRQEKK